MVKPDSPIQSKSYFFMSLLVIVALVIVAALIVLFRNKLIFKPAEWVSYCGGYYTCDSGTPSFEGINVEYNEEYVKVVNSSVNKWDNCAIGANNYSLENPPSIYALSSTMLKFNDFVKTGNIRMDTGIVKPTEFGIICHVNGGSKNASRFLLN